MEDFKNQLEVYKNELKKTLEKSQDSFEKQLSYISAGAFGITLAFIDKVVGKLNNANSKWLIIIGWVFLASTFIINLFSHIIATKYHLKTMEEIETGKYDSAKTDNRNRIINNFNFSSVTTLLIGILLIIIFISLNI